jgi:uncharacterized protein (TIGR02246 family)
MIKPAFGSWLAVLCATWTLALADETDDQQLKLLRDRIDSYVAAFNETDVEALAEHWADGAEYVHPLTAERIQGRDAIHKAFVDLFENEKQLHLSVAVDSLRLITDAVAIEDGTATVVSPKALPEHARYTAIHVKQADQWYRESVREVVLPNLPQPPEALRTLAWMVGAWESKDEKVSLRTQCRWVENAQFLSRAFSIANRDRIVLAGTQIIGWDPAAGAIRSWTFDSEGGFSEGVWKQRGDRWIVKANAVMPDGRTGCEQRILTPVDENRFMWKAVARQVDGQLLPNAEEVAIVRVTNNEFPTISE